MLVRALIFSIVASVACGSPPEPAADASSEPDLHVEADTVVAEVEHALPNPTGMLEVPLDGYQILVGPFTVPPGEEIVLCNYVDLGNATTRDLSRLQTAMKAGSHHMNLYLALSRIDKQGTQDCGSDTMGQLIIFGAQESEHDLTLPEGIGYALPANSQVILEAHYINPTLEPMEGLGVANIHLAPEDEEREQAGIMAFFPDAIKIPAMSQAVASARCVVPFDADLFILMSHMHSFGQRFEVFVVDPTVEPEAKTLIYENNDWHTPEYTLLDHGDFIEVKAGQIIEFACHYDNQTEQTVTRGPSAATDEMCIFGAAYVPFHGFLLCQSEEMVCPEDPIDPTVDPKSSLCAHYFDCIGQCGNATMECNNCCSPAMTPECMLCVQGLMGCAIQQGCASGLASIDLNCVAEKCEDEFTACFVDPL